MKTTRLLIFLSVACAFAVPLSAGDSPIVYRDYCTPADEAIVAVPRAAGGIWYFADDDTGELRRRVAAEQAKTGSLNRSSNGPTMLVQPDGTKLVDLGERFMTDFVVRIENGKPVASCVDHRDAHPQATTLEAK